MGRLLVVLLVTWLNVIGCSDRPSSSLNAIAGKAAVAQSDAQREPTPLSAAGEQELRSIVQSGRLTDLQWPNFSNHAPSIKEFYEETGYKLGWSQSGAPTPQALELIRILEEAEQKGLDSKDYDGPRWHDRVQALENKSEQTESALVKFDVALTVSATRYISDLHLGRVDPENLHKDFDPEREPHDPGAFLRKDVLGAQSVKAALTPLECPYAGYQRELVALHNYLQMASHEVVDPLPDVQKPIEVGQSYEAIDKLVHRLQFLGDLPASVTVPAHAKTYSKEISEGVTRFQNRHGMEGNGKLGPQTIAEMNQHMNSRVQQLRLSLERWRWLPHSFSQPPIIVNIPEFKLRASGVPGEHSLAMPVVVGKAMRTQTPVLSEEMEYVVFWPYWNVPPSILRGEMIPKIGKDPMYLQRNGYEVATHSGEVVTDGVVSSEVLAQLKAGKLMIRQKPGPKNALGLAKFIFPNDNNVYLHSTPAQSLFSRTRRDFSHGCIRVEDPKALAVWVLRNNPGWTNERVAQAFAGGEQQQVNLKGTIPVLIVYATAVAEEDGRIVFLHDIYGHDKALKKLEEQAYASRN